MQGYQTLLKQKGEGGNKPSKNTLFKTGLLLKELTKLEVVRNYYFIQISSVQQYV